MKKLPLYIILIVTFLSCEEKIDWEIDARETDLIVVEGTITDQMKPHLIKLSKPVLNLNDIPEPVSGAILNIHYKDGNDTVSIHLTESINAPGNYFTPPDFQGITWKTYALTINYGDEIYYASDYLKGVIPVGIISGYTPVEDNLYKINVNYSQFVSNDPAIYYINLDWSDLPDTTLAPNGTKKARLVYYSLPSIDVNGLFPEGFEEVYFPAGTIITQEKYSISSQYAEYLRTMLAETQWRGGLFDTNPANVETNLSKGAIGYFSACGYISDSFVFIP
jgi:hypothetical protein